MSKKYHLRERTFLNLKPEMRAYVIAVVEDTRDALPCCEEHRKGGEIVFELASCYDEIYLHFDMSTADERENSLHKATKLAEVATAFRQAIANEIAAIEERNSIQLHTRASAKRGRRMVWFAMAR
ncbi:MAG: hypothetical protein ABL952_18365 [Pyrinomonadaceae bacterium]